MKEKANLTLAVGTIPLPSHFTFIHPGIMCRVAGWGQTAVNEPASSTLQEVKLRLMEPRACSHFSAFNHNLQLCVGNPQSTKSTFKVILRLRCLHKSLTRLQTPLEGDGVHSVSQ